MKKLITLFAAVGFIALSLTSCKKDFTCVCTDSNGEKTTFDIPNSRRPEAKLSCETYALGFGDCSLD